MQRWSFAILALAVATSPLLAQQPVIQPNGIVNAASLAPDPLLGPVMISRRLSTILGQDLAVDSAIAEGFPLPTMLAGTTVLIDGVPAYLLSVSPTRITFQAPTRDSVVLWPEILAIASVVVTTTSGSSDPFVLPYIHDAAGLYTQDGSGCGQGLIYNLDANGVQTLNSPANSASPGDYLSVLGTGFLGFAGIDPVDGNPAVSYPSNWGGYRGTWLGITGWERDVTYYSGALPLTAWTKLLIGQVGIDEARIQLAPNVPEGCAVPLRVFGGRGSISQPVLISIHKGGGQCEDPPLDRAGSIHWSKTIENPATYTPTITETFVASFVEAPGNLLQSPAQPLYPTRGPSCPGTAGRGLDGGSLQIDNATGESVVIPPSTMLGTLKYLQTTLPAGTIQPGTLQLSAPGGADLGAFQTELTFPRELTILERFQPGDSIVVKNPSPDQPITVHWTGGTADVNVMVGIYQNGNEAFHVMARGDEGVAVLSPQHVDFGGGVFLWIYPNLQPGPGLSIRVTVTPVNSPGVQVPGIVQPVRQDWVIEYRFQGLVGV